MTFQPVGDRVLIELSPRSRAISLLELPQYVKDMLSEGVVVSCGKGRMLDNGRIARSNLEPGDRVAFVPPANVPVMETGHLIIRMDDIVGFVEE